MCHMNPSEGEPRVLPDIGCWDAEGAARALDAADAPTEEADARTERRPITGKAVAFVVLAVATAIILEAAGQKSMHGWIDGASIEGAATIPALGAGRSSNRARDPMQTPTAQDSSRSSPRRRLLGAASAFLLAPLLASPAVAQCPGDIYEDGLVNGGDLGVLLAYWGPTTSSPASQRCDLDGDGMVDGQDLGILLSAWGRCLSVPTWAIVLEALPNPGIVTDPALRAAIVSTGRPWRVKDAATGIEMVLIPPGTFEMGCRELDPDICQQGDLPVHTVTLTQPFYLGRYELTQAEWTARMGSNPSLFQGADDSMRRPVDSVTWDAAHSFTAAAGMRLPSEAEWEYAYRAGTDAVYHGTSALPFGFNDASQLGTIAWFGGGSGGFQTQTVGQLAGNGFGLHDMSGNVWEWVFDWFDLNYYSISPNIDPPGPATGAYRACRGGGFTDMAWYSRGSTRHAIVPGGSALYTVGFRVARNP
ncbi:MAG: hypothetical protein FGM39_06995 [Phycisphaerales bacterium]|nr:hypothetical protein [Phycisphaerales bacterium]